MRELELQRVTLDAAGAETVKKEMTARVAERAHAARDARAKETELMRQVQAPVVSLIERDAAAFAALKKLREVKRASLPLAQPNHVSAKHRHMSVPSAAGVTPGGFTVVGPPYDIPWTDRQGNAHGNQYSDVATGGFGINTGTVTGDWSSQSAGIGIVLTTATPVTALITPDATFDYAWADTASFATSHTGGLVGVLVQDLDGAGTIIDARQNLWSDGTGWLESHDGSGNGYVQSFISSLLVPMTPAHRYLVWTWCWGESDGNMASCRLDARLFFLAVSATSP